MAASDLINLSGLIDDAECFALVREHRWLEGVRCPACDSGAVIGTATTICSPVDSGIAARRAAGVSTT